MARGASRTYDGVERYGSRLVGLAERERLESVLRRIRLGIVVS